MPEEKEATKRIKPLVEEIKPEEPKPVPTPAASTEASKIITVPETNNIDITQIDKESKTVFLKFFTLTFLIVVFLILLGGGIYVYMSGIKNTNPQAPSPIATATPLDLPTPTPASTPAGSPKPLNSYKVSILNGNGQIGVAGDAKAIVEKAGFKVSGTANADNFNFDTTIVQAKDSVPQSVLDTLTKALSVKYSVSVGDNLDTKDSFDIIITIGAK